MTVAELIAFGIAIAVIVIIWEICGKLDDIEDYKVESFKKALDPDYESKRLKRQLKKIGKFGDI